MTAEAKLVLKLVAIGLATLWALDILDFRLQDGTEPGLPGNPPIEETQ